MNLSSSMIGGNVLSSGSNTLSSSSNILSSGSTRVFGGISTQYSNTGVRTYETTTNYSPITLQGGSSSGLGNTYTSGPIRVGPVGPASIPISTSSNVQERGQNGQIVTKSVQKITDDSSRSLSSARRETGHKDHHHSPSSSAPGGERC